MKINKHVIALTICLTMSSFVRSEESINETNRLSSQGAAIAQEVASVAANALVSAIENAVNTNQTQNPISLSQAHTILQDLMDSLIVGSTFEINDVKYVVQQAQ